MFNFIKATEEFNTFEKAVPAPYIRKSFFCEKETVGTLKIAACGFYELFFNGKHTTKGFLAPYISNTDDYIYYDEYTVTVEKGENIIGLILGNGFQNNPGGYVWEFDKSPFRSAPMVALELNYTDLTGKIVTICSDESFKTNPSPIRYDDYRFGECYDANFEITDWCLKGFDDSEWNNCITANPPKGELKLCEAEPIVKQFELKPVQILKDGDAFIYDFGISYSGTCRLNIRGKKDQRIELQYADLLNDDGTIVLFWFTDRQWERDKDIVHKDVYICKGSSVEAYTPTFTYHGFRYVRVSGITPEQATEELLTFVAFHSNLETKGDFSCSDDTVNKLQQATRRSDLSNFHYFPTDCPHREKNGWTADAALSTEQMLLNFNPEKSFLEWLRNICKAQNEEGSLPGIVPTGGWGFEWGNGPAWDCVLLYLPYYLYIYRGETEPISVAKKTIVKYLKYINGKRDENGLIHIGLGDWEQPGRNPSHPKAPLELTDTVTAMDIANKAAFLFEVIGESEKSAFAKSLAEGLRASVRKKLIDFDTFTAVGECQTSQAMCIFYNVFDENEKAEAFQVLLKIIHQNDSRIDCGVLGARVIFHVLSDFGYSELAYKMIVGPEFPSYGNWIERGATTLWECFVKDIPTSANHHFWGDISGWFIKHLSGIQIDSKGILTKKVQIKPSFVAQLQNAEGYHITPYGKISSHWIKQKDGIILKLEIPDDMEATVILEKNYHFADGTASKPAKTGEYRIYKAI